MQLSQIRDQKETVTRAPIPREIPSEFFCSSQVYEIAKRNKCFNRSH